MLRWCVLLIAGCGLLLATPLRAQQPLHTTLQGTVVDAETEKPLQDVHVFVAESMKGTVTDAQGRFRLTRVPAGAQRLYVSMLGYEPEARDTLLEANHVYRLRFQLEPTVLEAGSVTVTAERDERWQKRREKFERLFVGETPNADSTEVLNPEVLHLDANWWGRLEAESHEPLVLENRALGYRVQYFLEEFSGTSRRTRWDGEPLFEALTPEDSAEAARWEENRRKAYYGSFRHFLRALLADRVKEEGFLVYQEPDREMSPSPTDRRRRVDPRRYLSEGPDSTTHHLNFRGRLEIIYREEEESEAYLRWRREHRRPGWQRSYIEMNDAPATVDRHGEILEPYAVTLYGYFAFERIAELLPKEYEPDAISVVRASR